MSRGQTRRSLPHKSSRSQKPAIPCSAKMNHSCGRPLTRLIMPAVKASPVASAIFQSVRRGDILRYPLRRCSSLSIGMNTFLTGWYKHTPVLREYEAIFKYIASKKSIAYHYSTNYFGAGFSRSGGKDSVEQ